MKLCGACKSPISALFLAAALAGCAPPFAPPPDIASETATIKFAGVVIVQSSDSAARKARIVWTRIAATNELPRDTADIKTPLGTTQARLAIDASGMQIEVGGRPAKMADAAPDLRKWLDALPPPHSIGYWLAGASDPAYSTREIFAANAPGIVRLQQHDWEAEYAERDSKGRPLRILMRPLSPLPELPGAEAEVRIAKWLSE